MELAKLPEVDFPEKAFSAEAEAAAAVWMRKRRRRRRKLTRKS
jgi:hypothetical protein